MLYAFAEYVAYAKTMQIYRVLTSTLARDARSSPRSAE
jgi:hypothetical protein